MKKLSLGKLELWKWEDRWCLLYRGDLIKHYDFSIKHYDFSIKRQ